MSRPDPVAAAALAGELERLRAAPAPVAVERLDALARAFPRNPWLRLSAALAAAAAGRPAEAWLRARAVRQALPAPLTAGLEAALAAAAAAAPGPLPVNRPADYSRRTPGQRFLPALPRLEPERPGPAEFPFELAFPPLPVGPNDFRFLVDAAHQAGFRRDAAPALRLHLLAEPGGPDEAEALLAALARQTWPAALTRVTLGGVGPEALPDAAAGGLPEGLDLRRHDGPPLRRLPRPAQLALAEGCDALVFLAPGTLPDPTLLERAARYLAASDALLLVLVPAEPGATAFAEGPAQERWLRERMPFRRIRSLDFAVSAARFRAAGGFEPRFEGPELAASELAYRLWERGAWALPLPVAGPVAPPGRPVPSDGALFRALCPNPWDRKAEGRFEVPKVSVYIPAWRAARYIASAVDSVLEQDFEDLEVCIADDGSPDTTLELIERRYGGEPRVRWVSNRNGGIGAASNAALRLCRGTYVGQLDSDDRLKPGAVRRLAAYLDEHPTVVCAYSSCERVDAEGDYLRDEYSFPVYSREKMLLTSIAHHFRMFRRQAWYRTEGFREDIVNAVDYDMFLKLSELGPFHHLEEKLYQRRWHGENTSAVNVQHQTRNTHVVQTMALERMGLDRHWQVHVPKPDEPRRVTYRRQGDGRRLFFWPDYSRPNPYQRLLYAPSAARLPCAGASIEAVLKAAARADDPGAITFHLHWLNKIFVDATAAGTGAATAAGLFLDRLAALKDRGVRIAWTVHNTISHDSPWQAEELALSQRIAALADTVHLHAAGARAEVEAWFPLPADRIRVSRHGHYIGAYPDVVDRDRARAALGLDPADDVILFLGQIRPYKGVETLVQAVAGLLSAHPRAVLLLAGGGRGGALLAPVLETLPAEARARIRLYDRFVDNMELQLFFRAADVAAFPYRHILTSGSLMLALGFGVPAVIPAVAMTREVLAGTGAGLLYDGAEGAPALAAALAELLVRKQGGGLPAMQAAARARAEALTWPDAGFLAGEAAP